MCSNVNTYFLQATDTIPQLFYWHESFVNFGDFLSHKVVERITGNPVPIYNKQQQYKKPKFLAIGSILSFARQNDIVWGAGINGKLLDAKHYLFTKLDIRAVRGPLTRQFLQKYCNIFCPEIYGDPALLTPYLFPEFKRKKEPRLPYVIIPHYSERHLFENIQPELLVDPTKDWRSIIKKILNSKFVISTSLHGIIVAEAFGIPARLLRVTNNEPLFKFHDYYLGSGRLHFNIAFSIEEALAMGGEPPFICDLQKLYQAFPQEYWQGIYIKSWAELVGQKGYNEA